MKTAKEGSHQGIQTCHLCGKVQCGQRLGRVKCAYCSRIFCLQQLQRKFGIIATANDPCFKCPRCTGVCCCMCNCQRPPPHVHCKVYKVRQNKVRLRIYFNEMENPANKKRAEKDPDVVYPALATAIPLKKEVPIPESVVKVETQRQVHPEMSLATMPRIPSLTIMDSCLVQPTRDDSGKQVEGSNWDGFQSGWGDAPNVWNDSTTDIPGSIINSIWL